MEESVKKALKYGLYAAAIGFTITFLFNIWIVTEFPVEENIFLIIFGMILGALQSALYYGLFVFFITLIIYYFKDKKKQKKK